MNDPDPLLWSVSKTTSQAQVPSPSCSHGEDAEIALKARPNLFFLLSLEEKEGGWLLVTIICLCVHLALSSCV